MEGLESEDQIAINDIDNSKGIVVLAVFCWRRSILSWKAARHTLHALPGGHGNHPYSIFSFP
jgi:hypothetical protein